MGGVALAWGGAPWGAVLTVDMDRTTCSDFIVNENGPRRV